MNGLLSILATWPQWSIFALVGAILGAGFTVAGFGIERLGLKIGRFAGIVGIALTPTVTRELVIPAIVEARENQGLPTQVDDITTLMRITVANKVYTYHYELSDDIPEMTDITVIKTMNLSGMCDFWRPFFARDEIREAIYSYKIGALIKSFSVRRSDC